MDKQTLIQRLMETFLIEFEERLQTMSRDLLALEASDAGNPDRERRLLSLLRDAHSLKGAARAVDVQLIEEACHRLEEILGGIQRNPKLLEGPLFQLLFSAIDGLAEVGTLLRGNQSLEGSLLAGVSLEMELYIDACLRTGAQPRPAPIEHDDLLPEVEDLEPAAKVEAPAEMPQPSAQEILSVRIDTEKLDSLLSRSGELLGARQRLRTTADQLVALSEALSKLQADWRSVRERYPGMAHSQPEAAQKLSPRLQHLCEQTPQRLQSLQVELDQARLSFTEDWRLLDQAGMALDEQVRRIRMLPFAHCCAGFDRVVRDLARGLEKEADFQIEGGDVEIDRSILEGLKDPLRHLIRNAIDHGIEKPDERRRLGKPPRGRIQAAASLRGAQVQVLVSDDGKGLAVEAIRQRAKQMNLPMPENDRAVIEAVFAPGFSTAASSVSMVSGRGIGLDVVRNQIKGLHGEIEVTFTPGQGTRFQLLVPLTLTLLRVLLIKAQNQVFAISNTYVHKLMRVSRSDVLWVGERPMLLIDGRPISLVALTHVLGLPQPEKPDWQGKLPLVVLRSEQRIVAFLVDELLAEQEVMVKSLGARVQRIRNIAGAVILPDGEVALTLHVADLLQSAGAPSQAVAPTLQQTRLDATQEKKQRRILVVDDSMTTRSLERSLLESAGFLVDLASDGVQGWDRIQGGGIDLVLSDVDMPLMNGYKLTQTIRRSERFRKLPVILITSNNDAKSRERGMQAGASAYIAKGEFDQNVLLSLLEQLLRSDHNTE